MKNLKYYDPYLQSNCRIYMHILNLLYVSMETSSHTFERGNPYSRITVPLYGSYKHYMY